MITTVLLDLDDTIFDFKACEQGALSCALEAFSLPYTVIDLEDYDKINDAMWKMLEKGEITREALRVRRFEVFLQRFNRSIDAAAFADSYMRNLSSTNALIPGARDLLKRLSSRYLLFAVTNGYEQTQMGRIKSADIGKYFRKIYISQVIGAVKPKKEFFDYCAADIPGFSKQTTVLIGDSPTSDILGGNEYGIYTIRYNPRHDPNPQNAIPDREAYFLDEIDDILFSL